MSPLSLSYVRANLSALVRKAAKGTAVPVAIRGKVEAYLVSADSQVTVSRLSAPRLRGSLRLLNPLEGSRPDYLRWLDGKG
jgi:antitoxin (DNA-binding transcriptional repressor) of toxin-antitoxin stability system